MPHLKILRGREVGRTYELGDETFLGRDESNTFRLLDETSSRHHAKVARLDDAFVVIDLGSNNGTFVNGQKIKEHFLKNGDQILIGKTLLVFEGREEIPQAVTVAVVDTSFTVEREVPAENPRDDVPRLKQLYEIAALCNSEAEARKLLESLAGRIRETLDADVAVAILDGEDPAVAGKSGEVQISRSAVDRARQERKAVLLSAETAGGRTVVAQDIRSIVCAPLVRRGRSLGVLYADLRKKDRKFAEDDLAFLNAAAQQAALALDRAVVAVRTREQLEPRPMIGQDPLWQDVLKMTDRAAQVDSTVLLLGESGTGKELVARALHERSPRKDGPFVAINCGAIVETLVESELFGHERGAFTGANRTRHGRFEAARGGTLFLDEIGEISAGLQAKLLRVLQEKTFHRVGGTVPITVDVRIVAATNRDLAKAVKETRFREDLYYRLSVVAIRIPPLRERRGDIPVLCAHFLERARQRLKKRILEVDPAAMEALMRYTWPGNVRELENVLERSAILTDGDRIDLLTLPPEVRGVQTTEDGWPIQIDEAEKLCIRKALVRTGGRKGEAAKLLGISWPTLNKKLKDYGLE